MKSIVYPFQCSPWIYPSQYKASFPCYYKILQEITITINSTMKVGESNTSDPNQQSRNSVNCSRMLRSDHHAKHIIRRSSRLHMPAGAVVRQHQNRTDPNTPSTLTPSRPSLPSFLSSHSHTAPMPPLPPRPSHTQSSSPSAEGPQPTASGNLAPEKQNPSKTAGLSPFH